MKAASPREIKGRAPGWIVPLLAALVSATTVLGAVLLSLPGQAPGARLVVQASREVMADVIPTAYIATVPPLTAIPTWDAVETPSETPVSLATTVAPVLVSATVQPSTSTPWPCAGGAPLHWKLYVVQWGDTLFSLTRRHGTTVQEAIYYNCLQSENVRAGQRLYLPPLPTPVPWTPTPSLAPTPAPPTPTLTQPAPAPTWTATPSPLPTASSTATLTPEPVVSPTATLTPGPVVSPTATLTPEPVISPTATLTPEPVISPTATLTPEPVVSPTATLTPEPVVSPTASPTSETVASPTPEPAANPTSEPVASPTPEPSPTP